MEAVVDRARSENITLTKEEDLSWDVPTGILCMILGTTSIYSLLFAIGNLLYGNGMSALFLAVVAAISGLLLFRAWDKLRME
jgi:solute:Na+ symporter, SSS family